MNDVSTPRPGGGASRRRFLAATGTGLAVAGVATAIPLSRADAEPVPSAPDVRGPMVAFVEDAATGRVAVLHGDKEVVVQDQRLVALIAGYLGEG